MKKGLMLLIAFMLFFNSSFAISDTDIYKKVDGIQKIVNTIFSNKESKDKYYEPFKNIFLGCSKNCKNQASKSASMLLYENYEIYFGTGKINNEEARKKYNLKSVIDGDTIKIILDGEEKSVRLIGLDTPEKSTTRFGYPECYGEEAGNYLELLLSGDYVELEFDETQGKYDKYDRLLAYVFVNGENVNEKMIGEGYGWEYTYNKAYKYQKEFEQAQIKAKNNNKGLWNKCNGERKAVKEEAKTEKAEKTEQTVGCLIKGNIGNNNQKIYHIPGCPHYEKTVISTNKGEKWLCSEDEAISAGWRKCK